MQVALSAACAVAAATRAAWYDAAPNSMRIEILAPCGRVAAPPSRVVWSASRPIEQLQLEWLAERSTAWLRRRFAPPVAHGAISLTNDERAALAAGGAQAIVAVALAADGEWLAESAVTPLLVGPGDRDR